MSDSTLLVDGLLAALEDKIGDVRAAAILALQSATITENTRSSVEAALKKAFESDDFYWAREAARETMKALRMAAPGA